MSEHASIFSPSARSCDTQAAVPTAEICMAMPRGCRYNRRAEIRLLFEQYVIGSMPPKPKLDKIVPIDPAEAARGARAGAAAVPPPAAAAGGSGFTPSEGSVTRLVDLR